MENYLKEKIASKEALIGILGLGYIGLSLADAFREVGFSILGYDYNEKKIKMLKHKENYLNFLNLEALFSWMDQGKFTPSADLSILQNADIFVISVPTSLDRYGIPDLSNLRHAFHTVFKYLKKDQLIILQSSTYPGTIEEELLPILQASQLQVGKDFYLAHVPEVVDIGNPNYSFTHIPRIVSGVTPNCLELAKFLYEQLGCQTVSCSSTRVAEAAKLLQNSYRLVNISFINEMKVMLDRMGIDVWEVIEAASSKPFGFTSFYPGPGIGGDCIPVTPFYLVWKARVTEGPTTLIEQAGHVNETAPIYVFNKIVQSLNLHKKTIGGAKILVLGVGYKKDVNDIRHSPALNILSLLKKMLSQIYYHDPFVQELTAIPDYPHLHLKSIVLDYHNLDLYDAVVIITDHSSYNWKKIVAHSKLVIDTRNVTKNIRGSKKKVIRA